MRTQFEVSLPPTQEARVSVLSAQAHSTAHADIGIWRMYMFDNTAGASRNVPCEVCRIYRISIDISHDVARDDASAR